MQLRSVDLRSVGPSSQKLWPKFIFTFIVPFILHCEPKKIRTPFSRHFSDPTQKAKLSKMVKETRIQPVPVTGSNLQQNDSRYCLYRDPCKVSPYINLIQDNGCLYRDAYKVSPYIKNNSCLYREPCKVTPYIVILHKTSICVRCHLT